LAQFRNDLEAFVSYEIVSACIGDFTEQAPRAGIKYHAFVDPSGGSSDSMTLAISHQDGERVVIDAIREVKPPFSPESVVSDFAALLASYAINTIKGDRYGGEWCREPFRKLGINYAIADKPKSDLFRDLLPRLNSGTIELPKSERLINQLVGLERRTSRGGRDSIDHSPGGHDDLANAVAGAADFFTRAQHGGKIWVGHGGLGGTWRGYNPRPSARPNVANEQSPACTIDFAKGERSAPARYLGETTRG
jgi:hypothetical protein